MTWDETYLAVHQYHYCHGTSLNLLIIARFPLTSCSTVKYLQSETSQWMNEIMRHVNNKSFNKEHKREHR